MAGEVLLVTQFLAASLMLLLAAWLLYLNFHSRVVRAFSLFLLLRAMNILTTQFGRVMGEPFGQAYWADVRGYYEVAVLSALGYFLLVYTGRPDLAWKKSTGWLILVSTLVVELLYAFDHCISLCETETHVIIGPLGILVLGIPIAFAAAAAVLFRDAGRGSNRSRQASAFLAGAVLFLNALVEVSTTLSYVADLGLARYQEIYLDNGWQWIPLASALAAFLACVGATSWLVRLRPKLQSPRAFPIMLGLAGLAVASGIFTTFFKPSGEFAAYDTVFLIGAWRLSLPIVVSLAILRHRLFGIDLRIRKGISRGLVAGFILATFFIVSKIAENKVTEWFEDKNAGIYVGGAVAGLLLFAISPLQKVGERVAKATVPRSFEGVPPAERLQFYRVQAQIAWGDGLLGRRERLLLDRLRERLGIPPAEAARIESQAASTSRPQRSGRPLAVA